MSCTGRHISGLSGTEAARADMSGTDSVANDNEVSHKILVFSMKQW